MEVRVTVFERRVDRQIQLHTVGLGRHETTAHASTQVKAQHRLVEGLRKAIEKLFPEDLVDLELVRGRKLELLELELDLLADGVKRRFRGRVPVVIEPRTRGPAVDGDMQVVYHPLRTSEWFVHEEGRLLADEARLFFKDQWARLSEPALAELRADGRDRLRLIAFSASPRRVLAKVSKKDPKPVAFLGAAQSPKGRALLSQLGTNETLRAVDGRLAPGLVRSPWREQLQQLACGADKASVVLVGPSGAGKSELVTRWIFDLLEADGYAAHRNLDRVHEVWRICGNRIIAGMSYLGQWEQRCVDLLDACRKRVAKTLEKGGRAILWVDDIHAWGQIGESRESERNLATFFAGPLARGEVTMVAETTPEGFTRLSEEAPALASAFTTVFVEPSSPAETSRLLLGVARDLERRHGVAFDPGVFEAIVHLGGAVSAVTAQPGRALDLLRALAQDEQVALGGLRAVELAAERNQLISAIKLYRELTGVGLKQAKDEVEHFMARGTWRRTEARTRLAPARPRSLLDLRRDEGASPEIGQRDLIRLLATRTGMPEVLLTPERRLAPADLSESLRRQVMGQEHAVRAMTDLVLRIKSGLVDAGRPHGVYLFTGPTGTGKTEMAKCLAEYLYGPDRLVRIDMSELSGPDAPSRLIGDRFEPEGLLTSKVRVQPFCVVLLDEIEKAAPAVLNLLLQLFEDGRLTDATGITVDFTHTVVIMTSNLGARTAPSIGFDESPGALEAEVEAAVRSFFPPELFNRIDRVVSFGPLSFAADRQIARRELRKLLDRRGLTERSVYVRFTDAVVDLAVQRGFDPHDGARSSKRWLEHEVGAFLADEIASRPAAAIRTFWLHVVAGELRLFGQHLEEAPTAGPASTVEALLEWSAKRLRATIPSALQRAERLARSTELEALARVLSRELLPAGSGDHVSAAAVYNIDALREELRQVVLRLQTQSDYDPLLAGARDLEERTEYEGELVEAREFAMQERKSDTGRHVSIVRVRNLDMRKVSPALPLQNRPAVLEALSSLFFLEHAVACAVDREQHAVTIELTRLSRSAPAERFATQQPGLLEWLVEAYERGRGAVEEIVVVSDDGSVCSMQPFSVRHACAQVAMRVVGPAVRRFYEGEHGTHVRETFTGGTEMVRVRVLAGDAGAAEHLARLDADRHAFVAALEAGAGDDAPLGDNPDAMLPIIRRYRYDPERIGEPSPIEVEDLPLAFVSATRVRHLREILPTLWLLGLGSRLAHDALEGAHLVEV